MDTFPFPRSNPPTAGNSSSPPSPLATAVGNSSPPPAIYTVSGRRLNPLAIEEGDLDIQDIAHHLACCNRFAGAANPPVNVALHSLWAARLVERRWYEGGMDGPPNPVVLSAVRLSAVRQALLHDASEAFLGDVTKWLKQTPEFTAYRAAEHRLQQVIYRWADCPLEIPSALEWADRVLVRYEMLRCLPSGCYVDRIRPEASHAYPPLTREELQLLEGWEPWGWERSKQLFLECWERVKP